MPEAPWEPRFLSQTSSQGRRFRSESVLQKFLVVSKCAGLEQVLRSRFNADRTMATCVVYEGGIWIR